MQIVYHHAHSSRRTLLTHHALHPFPSRTQAIDGVGKTVFTLAISLSAVSFGAHLASLLRPLIPRPSLPPPSIRYTLSALAVLTYAAAFPAYFRLPVRIRADAAAALLFAFPGALSRYLLSISLNKRLALFPLGTFAANTMGTAVIGAMEALQSVRGAPFSPASCALLKGVADGYCGCLTTEHVRGGGGCA